MDDILSLFNLDSKFVRCLNDKFGAVIAGSAPLAALTGSFKPNGLDIWVFARQHSTQADQIRHLLHNRMFFASRTLEPPSAHFADSLCEMVHAIERYKFYKTENNEIRVIYTALPVDVVISNFDFTICSIVYKGERFDTTASIQQDAKDRILRFTYDTLTANDINRIKKYTDRGFTLAPTEVPKLLTLIKSLNDTNAESDKHLREVRAIMYEMGDSALIAASKLAEATENLTKKDEEIAALREKLKYNSVASLETINLVTTKLTKAKARIAAKDAEIAALNRHIQSLSNDDNTLTTATEEFCASYTAKALVIADKRIERLCAAVLKRDASIAQLNERLQIVVAVAGP